MTGAFLTLPGDYDNILDGGTMANAILGGSPQGLLKTVEEFL
jgi:hypothetical protein